MSREHPSPAFDRSARGLTASAVLLIAAAGLAVFVLYFWNLDGVGLLGPDEPRYAAIGREMARSGDWITPRLWPDPAPGAPAGTAPEPWFEKPALIYWLTGLGFALGLGPELAPRLPVALFSAGFLAFFFWMLRREYGTRAAAFSTAVLGASAAWVGLSRVAVTDLPLAVSFAAAVLLALPWLHRGERGWLPAAGALLGVAVLAKGLVPLVLFLPAVWFGRKRWRDLVWPGVVGLTVAALWYLPVTLRHGRQFIDEFFLEHHFGRFASDALRHEQPFWFYLPVLLAGLFPWTPLAPLVFRTGPDARRRALLAVLLFGLLFFSASRNKLPGYLLPLMPAAAALIGIALAEARRPRWLPAACVALLGALPVVAVVLPQALQRGITHASLSGAAWALAIPALAAAAVVFWRRDAALAAALAVAGMAAGAVWIAGGTFPALDQTVSARAFWRREAGRREQLCVGQVHRSWRYNLNYYTGRPLPDCESAPKALRIEQNQRLGARITEPR